MKTKLLLILFIFSISVNSQTFTRTFPIPQDSNLYSMGSCAPIVQTADGGYILNYGYTYPNIHGSPTTTQIIKTDNAFLPLWRKELWGANGKRTLALNDGSTIFFENAFELNTFSFNLEKLNSDGQTIWRKYNFELSPNKISVSNAVIKDLNTIRLVGRKEINFGQIFGSSAQPVIMDFDLNGNYIQGFSLNIPLMSYGAIEFITKDTTGNYYIIIRKQTSRYIAKLSATDSVIWCKEFSFNNYDFYDINASIILNNGDLLIGGTYNNYSLSKGTYALVRITTDGNFVWSKTINEYRTSVRGLTELPSNEIIVTGIIYDENYMQKNTIMKMEGNGNLIWAKQYSNAFSISEAYQKTPNDWYYSAFNYSLADSQNPFLFNTDENGSTICNEENINFTFINNPAFLSPVTLTTDALSLLTPESTTIGQSEVLSYADNCLPLGTTDFKKTVKCTVSPNPSNGIINITSEARITKVSINSILGQKIIELYPNSLTSSVTIEVSGIYFITIETEKGTQTVKIIIEK